MPAQDINVVALVKGSERYVFLYDDDSRAEALRMLGRYASNPDLSFTWSKRTAIFSHSFRPPSRSCRVMPPTPLQPISIHTR